jgi:DNA topoisomerase-1
MGIDVYQAFNGKGTPALKHITDEVPGYTRLPRGEGFTYRCREGNPVKSPPILERLKALVLPPAWADVWICHDPRGYLQATGRDAKGRKQYRYHPDWTAYQQAGKFARMQAFVESLMTGRKAIEVILGDDSNGWNRRRVSALAIAVLDETGMRIGNQQYRRRNGTIGLTTLRRKHLEIDDHKQELHFEYPGKSKQERYVSLNDPELVGLIHKLSDLPGYEIFRYRDQARNFHLLDSADVNELIRELFGEEHSAKSFRTWAATAAAVTFYPSALEDVAKNPRKRVDSCLVERVADYLGNTVSICREYYIHPKVLAAVKAAAVADFKTIGSEVKAVSLTQLEEAEVIAYYLISR